jgi:hypothetical protein
MEDCVDACPATYAVEVGIEEPQDCLEFEFTASGVSLLTPAIDLLVVLDSGRKWRGRFFGGREGLNQLRRSPNPNVLVVVAGGVAYLVPVDAPRNYLVLPIQPVREVFSSPRCSALVIVGFTKLLAVGADGEVMWASPRLVADGFSEVRLGDEVIVVRGREVGSGRDIEITLDLSSGEVLDLG